MTDLAVLDNAFHFVMSHFMETRQAPHYSELALELGCPIEQGRKVLHELMDTVTERGTPAWIHPDTDWVASFCPLSNIPTQYRITVDGQRKWFGQ